MKEFFIKSAIFSFLIVMTVFSVIYLLPIEDDIYISSTLDKHRIIRETPQPRIIFNGDSNIAFGLDSSIIKKGTGYNVVNMGIIVGLGIIYYMDEMDQYLKKGDTVVLALDYWLYLGDGRGQNSLIEVTIFNPSIIKTFSLKNIHSYFSFIPLTFQRRLRGILPKKDENITQRAFRRSAFNEFGDNIGADLVPQPVVQTLDIDLPKKLSDDFITIMNDYADRCAEKGVEVYLAFPPMLIKDRAKQEKDLQIIYDLLKEKLKVKLIGKPQNYLYPIDCFFDNEFHLNTKGKILHSQRLLNDIKKYPPWSSAQ